MLTPESIACMLDGSVQERRRLTRQVIEIVDRATYFTLSACGSLSMQEDLVNEILLQLFRNDARLLRTWDSERASFSGYLGMIAGRFVRRRLSRRAIMGPLADLGLSDGDSDDLDARLAYRAALEELLAWVREHDNGKDLQRFHSMFVEQRTPADIAKEEGLSPDALYAWKSRFRRRLAKAIPHALELVQDGASGGEDDSEVET